MIPSPIMTAMEQGVIGRFEELTRSTSDVQDALISILSEKYVSIPELDDDNIVFAQPGFSIIATANSRDRGVNDLSSALKRRFNFVRIPVVTNKRSEAEIVRFRTVELLRRHRIELDVPPTLLDILLQSFADLRAAAARPPATTRSWSRRCPPPSRSACSRTPILHSHFFGDRTLRAETLGGSLVGSLARRSPEDLAILNKYWHGVVEPRSKAGRRRVAGLPGRRPPDHRHPVVSPGRVRRPAPAAAGCGRRLRRRPGALAGILSGIVDDVDRALREELEIFPVCHHSPASALAMVRRLREKQPKVIYLELCEDLQPLLDRAAQLPAAGGPAGVRVRAGRLPAGLGAAQRGRADHRGLGRVPGDRLRAGHARRRAGAGRPLGRPRLPVAAALAKPPSLRRPARPPPTRRGGGAARRRGRHRDRRPAAPLRRAGGAPAAPRPGAALVGVVGPVRRAAAGRRRLRHLPAGHGAHRQPVPAARPADTATGSPSTRTANATCGPGCASTSPHPAPTRRDCLYVCGAFHAASRVEQFGSAGATRFDHQPADRHELAVRAHPLQPLRDRGAVRARLRVGLDRRRHLGQGGQPLRLHPFRLEGQNGAGKAPEGRGRPAAPPGPPSPTG